MPTVLVRVESVNGGPGEPSCVVSFYTDWADGWTVPDATAVLPPDEFAEVVTVAGPVLLRGNASQSELLDAGKRLHRLVVRETVADRWSAVATQAAQAGTRLRMILDIGPPELRALPWELAMQQDETYPFVSPRFVCVRGN